MIERPVYLSRIDRAARRSPVTAILGPRQVGKTTLARMFVDGKDAVFLDAESPADRRRLSNPMLALEPLEGVVVIDEVQALPELFPVLRVLADRPGRDTRFVVLGSASPYVVRSVSETLAGRVEFVEVAGLGLDEIGRDRWERRWVRGGFPRSWLARSEADSVAWRESFIQTFLERDIPQLGFGLPAPAVRRFWTMLAHYHGQTWNASRIGRAMGLTDKTVRSWLDVLAGTYMVRELAPWHENVAKRQVKAPKVYLRDSGLLHCLLGLEDRLALLGHAHAGASFEGFALDQVLTAVRPFSAWFWGTHGGAELDLLFEHRGLRFGVELEFDEAPRVTKSMHIAIGDLGLEHLFVVYPGSDSFPLSEGITAWPVTAAGDLPGRLDRIAVGE